MLLLQQMIVLFIMMFIGFYIRKKDVIDDKGSKTLSWLVINVANPALIISGSVTATEKIAVSDLLGTLVVVVVLFAGLIALAYIVPFLMRVPKKSVGVYRVMTIFSNIGFMGFPLISSLYGREALVYAALFLIPFNLLMYTYGIMTMTPKEKKVAFGWGTVKQAFNIGTVSCVVAVIISLYHPTLPDFVVSTVTNLSNLTAPLSMMVIGTSLAFISIKDLFVDIRLLVFCFIKLLVIPIAGLFAFKYFIDSSMMLGICLVMLATPVASMTAMVAQQYEGDYPLASKGVALSTILSVVTMPIVAFITNV